MRHDAMSNGGGGQQTLMDQKVVIRCCELMVGEQTSGLKEVIRTAIS